MTKPSDIQSVLNAEIARRDSAPPFLVALSHEELAVRNLALSRQVAALEALANDIIDDQVRLGQFVAAKTNRQRLNNILHP